MIRLRWPSDPIDPREAVHLAHSRLVRLRGAGPWTFTGAGGLCTATMVVAGWTADAWGPWQPGVDGAECSLATNPPPIETLDPPRIPADAERLELASGERVWILPGRRAPRRIRLDGGDGGPATAYGVAAFELADRLAQGPAPADDIMRVVLLALASVNKRVLPEIALLGFGVSTDDIQPILEAAWRIPKAQGAGATSSSTPPASTPVTT